MGSVGDEEEESEDDDGDEEVGGYRMVHRVAFQRATGGTTADTGERLHGRTCSTRVSERCRPTCGKRSVSCLAFSCAETRWEPLCVI